MAEEQIEIVPKDEEFTGDEAALRALAEEVAKKEKKGTRPVEEMTPEELEAEKAALVEKLKKLQADTPAPTEPYELALSFRNGVVKTFVVTSFDPLLANGKLLDAKWAQDSAVPGDELLSYVDWSEVIMVSVASLDQRPARRARR